MYLCDKDIYKKLPEINFVANNSENPFVPDDQIQPCSVDLRLDNIFWIPRKRFTIDLRKTKLLEIEPRRYYKKVILNKGEHITLKPGKLLLGRIYEEFTIPNECAGKISGRSSFARLGIMIHLTGDFINPGYRGHMPLQLINFGNNPIKIFPYIPICQLQLVKVSDLPNRLYGVSELQSKYMNDDGGPSYWWRDKRIKKLQKALGEVNVAISIQESILQIIGKQEPEVIERLEKRLSKCSHDDLEAGSGGRAGSEGQGSHLEL
ncbi:MAG: dCTP deaminase [bacterium]